MLRNIFITIAGFLICAQGAAFSQEQELAGENVAADAVAEEVAAKTEPSEAADAEEKPSDNPEDPPLDPPMAMSSPQEEPIVEWDKRMGGEERLRQYGPDILGDQIDPHLGSISFEHTDVSLPGNSALEVAVRRRLAQGLIYAESVDVEFGDWELMVPRIHALSHGNWTGNRCSNSYATSFPLETAGPGNQFLGFEYSEGVVMDVPGAGAMQVLESKQGAHWPAAATHVTTEGWWLECTTASDGGQGFIAHAPNGDTYKFDEYIPVLAKALGVWGTSQLGRTRNILAASEVTDVHGNWVRYVYDVNGRLTRIHSNDGRQIDVGYAGASKLISQVTANGRTWQYAYGATTYSELPDLGYYGTAHTVDVLRTVTQPDGRQWSFQLDNMIARAGAGTQCAQLPRTLTITHPYGVTGTFNLAERVHRQSYNGMAQIVVSCPNDPDIIFNGTPPTQLTVTTIETMSVTQKQLSGPNMPTAIWTYTYEQDPGAAGTSGSDRTNWTRVQDPAGTHITYYHYWNAEPYGGKLTKREVRQDNASGALLETTQTSYLTPMEGVVGQTFAQAGPMAQTINRPSRVYETSISRLGDWYNTRFEYDSTYSSATYSHGAPTTTWEWSNTAGSWAGRRTTFTDYAHKTGPWILALPTKVTRNGVVFEEHGYNSVGQRIWTDQFGVRQADYTYHASSRLASVTDAINRVTWFHNYKRGIPTQMKRPDNEWLYRTVDDNGWITSETNARGYVTNFQYNNVGWTTLIDPPAPYTDSVITYNNVGVSNFNQTITRGSEETIVLLDALLRNYRTRVQPLSGGGTVSVTRREFDIHGRETFVSFPDTFWWPANGTDTTYDALGRPTEIRENVAPNATTTIEYMSDPAGARTRTTDPEGAVVNVYTRGYGAPDDGGVMQIRQWTDIRTEIARDIYGKMTSVRQHGLHNGYAVDQTQHYFYDARQRLCRHSAPETGDALFVYNDANEITAMAYGQPDGPTSCPAGAGSLPSTDRIERTYDDLGRVTFVDYPAGTADTTITYDDNGNVLTNSRGGAFWSYSYDSLDQVTKEKLSIDGKDFATYYAYNYMAALKRHTTPLRVFELDPNGLGQATGSRLGTAIRAENIVYDAAGRVTALDYGNGLTLTNAYNARQLLQRRRVKDGSISLVDFQYTHDDNGRILTIADNVVAGQNRTYGYDSVGRLVTADGPWGIGTFEYDSLGNLREKDLGGRRVQIDYDWLNRLKRERDTGGTGLWRDYAYDARGNVIDNDRIAFAYDAANQPVSITGAATGTFQYDGNGKRVKQTINGETIYSAYSLSGALLYRENATTTEKTDYVRVAGITVARIKAGVTSYLHADHLGSPVAATTTGGAIQWREDYTPYGEERQDPAANDNDENFTGHIRDEDTGLIYAQARYMDPVIGRFLSGDPVQFSEGKPQFFNRYSYTRNDPINKIDATGLADTIPEARYYSASQSAGMVRFEQGFEDRFQSLNASGRYINDTIKGAPGAQFINMVDHILTDVALANPRTAVAVGADQFFDNGAAYNAGNIAASGVLLSPLSMGAGVRTSIGAMAVGGAQNLSGAGMKSAYSAYDALSSAGVSIELSEGALEQIGQSVAQGASFSYDSDTNVLTATTERYSTGSRLPDRIKVDIDLSK